MTEKKVFNGILLAAVLILIGGCIFQKAVGGESQICEKQLFAMDTYMTFQAEGKQAEAAVDAAIEEVKRLDALLSTGSVSSEVSRINTAGGGKVSEDTGKLLERSLEFYEATEGLFDITVYPLMELWGFPEKEYRVPTETQKTKVLETIGAENLQFDGKTLILGEGQKIDFGGIAKGYASDRVMEIFQEYEITNAMISLGGNIKTMGVNNSNDLWHIGIRNPEKDEESVLGVLKVSGMAVVTSGGYERYFVEDGKTYIHILNPKTGSPADEDLLSVTIVSEDGTLADAMSTSIYLMGVEKGSEYWRRQGEAFEMVLVNDQGHIYVTEGIKDSFECSEKYTVITRE